MNNSSVNDNDDDDNSSVNDNDDDDDKHNE